MYIHNLHHIVQNALYYYTGTVLLIHAKILTWLTQHYTILLTRNHFRWSNNRLKVDTADSLRAVMSSLGAVLPQQHRRETHAQVASLSISSTVILTKYQYIRTGREQHWSRLFVTAFLYFHCDSWLVLMHPVCHNPFNLNQYMYSETSLSHHWLTHFVASETKTKPHINISTAVSR